MKVSILTPDLSHNCLGRAYLLAKIVQRLYEVEIVGPIFGDRIWEPLAKLDDIEYKFVKVRGKLKPYWQLKKLLNEITGDVIYATKPLFTSFGIGLLKKLSSKKPLILDIDDWELGFVKENYRSLSLANRFAFLAYSTIVPYGIGSYWNRLICEKLIPLANEITVSNSFLQKRFGGTMIWHARDTDAFDPRKFDKNSLREKYGIGKNKKVVMFLGTPRPYKGLEDLIKAVSLIQNRNILLILVGIGQDEYSQKLAKIGKETLRNRFKPFGLQPFEKVPEFLAMSDVVVIPQRKNFATVGQVPSKVFDAMAMAKPVIATAVSDLPEILDGFRWHVEAGNIKQLAETIQFVVNTEEAKEKGQKARQKCIAQYSWDALERVLTKMLEKYNNV